MACATAKKSQEEVVQHFQKLRGEQRSIAVKISEIEIDQNEHKLVIDTLKDLDSKRRCFRMVGGVLVERDVESVLSTLQTNHEKMGEILIKLNEQLVTKGKEIVSYKEEHKIKVEGERDEKPEELPPAGKGTQGVLV